MLTRRDLMPLAIGAAAIAAAPALADGFISLTSDGEYMTNEMPCDETVVEVRLTDGTTAQAWYSQNIMEVGDWDFVPAANGEPIEDANSIANVVAAWRPLSL